MQILVAQSYTLPYRRVALGKAQSYTIRLKLAKPVESQIRNTPRRDGGSAESRPFAPCRTLDFGLWTLDFELWTLNFGL